MLRPGLGLSWPSWKTVAAVTFAPQIYFGAKEIAAVAKFSSPAPQPTAVTTTATTASTVPTYTTATPTNPILYIGLAAAAAGLLVYMMKGSSDA